MCPELDLLVAISSACDREDEKETLQRTMENRRRDHLAGLYYLSLSSTLMLSITSTDVANIQPIRVRGARSPNRAVWENE